MKRASHNTRQYNKKAISRTTIFEFAGKRIFRFRMGGGPLRGAEGQGEQKKTHPALAMSGKMCIFAASRETEKM